MVAASYATTMSQRITPTPHNCGGCDMRAVTPCMFGHSQCSVHRPCVGQLYWEPQFCDVCKNLEVQLRGMTPKAKNLTLQRIKAMLVRCKSKIKEAFPNRNWEFEPFFSFTFKEFLQTPQETVQQPPVMADAIPRHSPALDVQDAEAIYDPEDPVEDLSNDEYIQRVFPDEQLPFEHMLIPDECTLQVCIKEAQGHSGQCTDPVHHPPPFLVAPRSSLRDRFEQGIPSKRSRSPSASQEPLATCTMDSPPTEVGQRIRVFFLMSPLRLGISMQRLLLVDF